MRHGIVIGAMKSGTTTLHHDFKRLPAIALAEKELSFFHREDGPTLPDYVRSFGPGATAAQCCLDISTTYSMWPDVDHVPERAASLLDGEARLVYMVRDPIERAISHHHHMVARGATTADFEAYLDEEPGLVGYGRYDQQAARWADRFGGDALLVVRLEDYSTDWRATARRILDHLGVDEDLDRLEPPPPANVTEESRVFTGRSRQVAESKLVGSIYRTGLRQLLPDGVRGRLRNTVLPKPPARPDAPPVSVLTDLAHRLAPAADYVASETGTPPWDLIATAERLGVAS